jgi:hypothetical protein
VIASYGRGLWILDDVASLRGWDQTQAADTTLFAPRPAYRYRTKQDLRSRDANSAVVGENPPYGADITFDLKQTPKQLEIAILGPTGEVLRTLKPRARTKRRRPSTRSSTGRRSSRRPVGTGCGGTCATSRSSSCACA